MGRRWTGGRMAGSGPFPDPWWRVGLSQPIGMWVAAVGALGRSTALQAFSVLSGLLSANRLRGAAVPGFHGFHCWMSLLRCSASIINFSNRRVARGVLSTTVRSSGRIPVATLQHAYPGCRWARVGGAGCAGGRLSATQTRPGRPGLPEMSTLNRLTLAECESRFASHPPRPPAIWSLNLELPSLLVVVSRPPTRILRKRGGLGGVVTRAGIVGLRCWQSQGLTGHSEPPNTGRSRQSWPTLQRFRNNWNPPSPYSPSQSETLVSHAVSAPISMRPVVQPTIGGCSVNHGSN